MKKIKKWLKCPKCGKKFEESIRLSSFSGDMYLDGKPEFEYQLKEIIFCPICKNPGYVYDFSLDNTNMVDDITISNNDYDSAYKFMIDRCNDILLLIELHFQYIWYLEFNGKKKTADIYREKVIKLIETAVKNNHEFDLIVSYIDSLRQLMDFNEAKDTVDSCKQFFTNNDSISENAIKIIDFENKLILSEDNAPHLMSEAINI